MIARLRALISGDVVSEGGRRRSRENHELEHSRYLLARHVELLDFLDAQIFEVFDDAATGTRVPRKTQAPPTRSGTLSTAGHRGPVERRHRRPSFGLAYREAGQPSRSVPKTVEPP